MHELEAHRIGSLLFCPNCGNLLEHSRKNVDSSRTVTCEQCKGSIAASSLENIMITTFSHPEAFPSPLRQKRTTATKVHDNAESRMIVTERCPNCGYHEAYSEEKQMRSADEGSTILYTCVSCRYGWRLNN